MLDLQPHQFDFTTAAKQPFTVLGRDRGLRWWAIGGWREALRCQQRPDNLPQMLPHFFVEAVGAAADTGVIGHNADLLNFSSELAYLHKLLGLFGDLPLVWAER